MRVASIVRRICRPYLGKIHARRMAAICLVVEAIASAKRVALSALGRSLRSRAAPKHCIKRVDRLLGNWRLRVDRWYLWGAIAERVIGKQGRPVVLVDWTKVGHFYVLAAAVPTQGRAIAIYSEAHPVSKLSNPKVEANFFRKLLVVLPDNCKPIIVGDAGFKGPLFQYLFQLGWDFVIRVRGSATIKLPDGTWQSFAELSPKATPFPRDLGDCRLYQGKNSLALHVVLVRARKRRGKHPWQQRYTALGGVPQSTIDGSKEPWLLATTLTDPARVAGIYRTRMQIEETFRDWKNPRFGLCLRHVGSRSAERVAALLLLVALASLALNLVGAAAERLQLSRRYQANTSKRRTLSRFVIGALIVARRELALLGNFLTAELATFVAPAVPDTVPS